MRTTISIALLLLGACTKRAETPQEGPPKSLVEHAERLGRKITDVAARSMLAAEIGAAFLRADRREDAAPHLAAAEQSAAGLADPNDKENVLSALATAWALSGDLDRAKKTAPRGETMVHIVEQLAARGDLDAARSMISAISGSEWKAAAEVHLSRALLGAGKIEEATKLSSRIQVPAAKDEATAALVVELFERGNKKAADSALNNVQSPHWRAEAVAGTARLYYRRGARKKALDAAEGIESHWIRARTYADLSGMAAGAGRSAEARRMMERSIELAEDIKDQVMQATALTDIAMRLIDRGRIDEAKAVLAKCPIAATRHRADAQLAGHLAKKGEMEKAYQVHRELETDVIWGSEAASQIARAHVDRGEFEPALEAAARIKTRELRLPSLAQIAVAHTLSGAPPDEALMRKLEQALFTGSL